MLIQLTAASTPSTDVPRDAIDRLLDCHARIRHHLQLAEQLAGAVGKPDSQITQAAHQLCRYFGEAFPLHVADEEQSLLPRLRPHARSAELSAALDGLSTDHAAVDPLVAELLSLWRLVAENGKKLEPLAGELEWRARELRTLFGCHLEVEEVVVLPWARTVLSAAVLEEVVGEMKQRRGA